MYPGIKGRTQGDKKLINPAKKAIDNVVFIKLNYVYLNFSYRQIYFHLKSQNIPIPRYFSCQYFNILP